MLNEKKFLRTLRYFSANFAFKAFIFIYSVLNISSYPNSRWISFSELVTVTISLNGIFKSTNFMFLSFSEISEPGFKL